MRYKKILSLALVVFLFFSQATTVLAQNSDKVSAGDVCKAAQGNFQTQCRTCFDSGGAWTAIGCISANPNVFIGTILRFAMGIGGGLAFFLIIFGAFQILTSGGNPEGLTAGKELIGGAIGGLLFIMFSLFILRTIGATMLGIPGFK